MEQLSLFDYRPNPPILKKVDPYGPTVKGKIDKVLTLPHPKMAWSYAEIELHQDAGGLWMWAVRYSDDSGAGGGYRVGPKWGKFAQSEKDALFYAIKELRGKLTRSGSPGKDRRLIMDWLDNLQ